MIDFERDITVFEDGTVLVNVHTPEQCAGQYCGLHNPSAHPLRDAPLAWINWGKQLVRICSHGERHPDPDDVAHKRRSQPYLAFVWARWHDHECCQARCCGWPAEDPDKD